MLTREKILSVMQPGREYTFTDLLNRLKIEETLGNKRLIANALEPLPQVEIDFIPIGMGNIKIFRVRA